MKPAVSLILIVACLASPAAAAPAEPKPSPIRDYIARSKPAGTPLAPAGASRTRQQTRDRNWIQRHPVLFGTMVGFGTGFMIGYIPGDDAVFYDFTATFNGMVLGGAGAAAGAILGWTIGKT
jgi:hypothetical protein